MIKKRTTQISRFFKINTLCLTKLNVKRGELGMKRVWWWLTGSWFVMFNLGIGWLIKAHFSKPLTDKMAQAQMMALIIWLVLFALIAGAQLVLWRTLTRIEKSQNLNHPSSH